LADANDGVPDHSLDDRVLIATWNIREFDSSKGGERGIEPLLYIAEIISAFDVVAIQEVREDLGPLNRLLGYGHEAGVDAPSLLTCLDGRSNGLGDRFRARDFSLGGESGRPSGGDPDEATVAWSPPRAGVPRSPLGDHVAGSTAAVGSSSAVGPERPVVTCDPEGTSPKVASCASRGRLAWLVGDSGSEGLDRAERRAHLVNERRQHVELAADDHEWDKLDLGGDRLALWGGWLEALPAPARPRSGGGTPQTLLAELLE
jgi:hypothetical protein